MKLATEHLAAVILMIAVACAPSDGANRPTQAQFQAGPWTTVFRVEDPDLHVVCWVADGNHWGGITCLPFHDIEPRLPGGDDE